MHSNRVQTFLTNRIASYYSYKLKSEVTIKAVDIEFFKKIVLKEILIKDNKHDSLFYCQDLKVDISKVNFRQHQLSISQLELVNPRIKIYKYPGEQQTNLALLIDLLTNTSKPQQNNSKSSNWKFRCESVQLDKLSLIYKVNFNDNPAWGIAYDNIQIENASATIQSLTTKNDTLLFEIENAKFIEKSGFHLKNLSAKVKVSKASISCAQLKLQTNEIKLAGNVGFSARDWKSYESFLTQVHLSGNIDSSQVELHDIGYFTNELKDIHQKILFSGYLSGTIADLHGSKLTIQAGNSTLFKGNADLKGIPEVNKMYLKCKVDRLVTNNEDINQIPLYPFDTHRKLTTFPELSRLSNIEFKGTISGLFNHLQCNGQISSGIGNASADLDIKIANDNTVNIDGTINTQGLNAGIALNNDALGNVAGNLTIHANKIGAKNKQSNIQGTLTSLQWNKYSYSNTAITIDLKDNETKAQISINDPNLSMNLDGTINVAEKLPVIKFKSTIAHCNITALHLLRQTQPCDITTQIDCDIVGNSIENLTGDVSICNTKIEQDTMKVKFRKVEIQARETNQQKNIKVHSDFVDASLTGSVTWNELGKSFVNLFSLPLPAYFNLQSLTRPATQLVKIEAKFLETTDFTRLFFPQVSIAPSTTFQCDYNSSTQYLIATIQSTKLKIYNSEFDNLTSRIELSDQTLKLNTHTNQLKLSDSLFLKNFICESKVFTDTAIIHLTWENHSIPENNGDINLKASFDFGPKITCNLLNSKVTIADSVWTNTLSNRIHIDTNSLSVQSLQFNHNKQSIAIEGKASSDLNDSLFVRVTAFNLANFNHYLLSTGLNISGFVNGKSSISCLYSKSRFGVNCEFSNLNINHQYIGNGYCRTIWDNQKEALAMTGAFSRDNLPNIAIVGFYFPKRDSGLDLRFIMTDMNLSIVSPFVKDYCKDLKGHFSGNINLKGPLAKPGLYGTIDVDAENVHVNYLGTNYSFKQQITISPQYFAVDNMRLYDQIYKQNKLSNSLASKETKENAGVAIVSGKVYHNNFKDFKIDFQVVPHKFMILNTVENDNSLYYGQGFVSGDFINIHGVIGKLVYIDASVKSEKVNFQNKILSSKLYIPLAGTSEVSQSNFITFVNHDSTRVKKNKYKVDLSGLQLNFDLEVTPDAEIQLVFDQKVGDIIKSRGNGVIKLEINTLGKFNMLGNYTIESGDYLFTLQNVMNKKFEIEKGGTIKWSGDPYDAELNLGAVYKLRTSLSPLFPNDSTGTYKRRYPVECKMNLSNKLLSPDINFNINLPSVNEEIRSDVSNMVNNDIEMNRQVFSLMVLGSFVTPLSLGSSNSFTSGAGAGGMAASSELFSNQISNMLSKISSDFDLGFKYTPGTSDKLSSQEYQLAMSTQLLNNRLIIDGNVGTASPSSTIQNTNTLVGDVNVEYKLTDDGKIKMKAFNRTNDNAILYQTAPYTQGVGIFYREEFNTINELFSRYMQRFRKKKNQPNSPQKQ